MADVLQHEATETRSGDESRPDGYCGLRMKADEYLKILDDGVHYELIDGVVVVSPGPTPDHQQSALEIATQLAVLLRVNPVGKVWVELDVHFGKDAHGNDIVYRPEVIFVRTDRLKGMHKKITCAPDLVVEVISAGSRRLDTVTKLRDYERFGVREYWLIDPERETMTFYRLVDGRFVEVQPTGDYFVSEAVPGFVLDLARVRESFRAW